MACRNPFRHERTALSETHLPFDIMQVGDMGSGDLLVLAGTSTGNVSRLRLQAPLAPGADPSEVQVQMIYSSHAPHYGLQQQVQLPVPRNCQWLA